MFRLVTVAALLVFGTACQTDLEAVRAQSTKEEKDKEKDKHAPDFNLKDINGKPVKLSDFKGKVVLLNFWATWCGPCKLEIPWFMEFEKEFKDKGLVVIGLAMDDEGWEVVKPYIEEKKINYRIAVADEATANAYGGVESLPTTFIIDREGRKASVHVGLVSKSDYRNDIVQLLER